MLAAVPGATNPGYLQQIAQQAANPTRPILDPGQVAPGWNQGNAYRQTWPGTRGLEIAGRVHQPLRRAAARRRVRAAARRPRPVHREAPARAVPRRGDHDRLDAGLGEDVPLAGRGPRRARLRRAHLRRAGPGHQRDAPAPGAGRADCPFCDPFAKPAPGEQTAAPACPSQQSSNFIYGTQDALTFLLSTPKHRYPNPSAGSASVNAFNPLWGLIDRRRDRRTGDPGPHHARRRSSATPWAPPRCPTSRASTRASRPPSRSTSSPARAAARRGPERHADGAVARRAVRVRLQRGSPTG